MARFDVHRRRKGPGYLLDCQADMLSTLRTRFMVPLLPQTMVPPGMARLHPVLVVDGAPHVMATHLASAVPLAALGEVLGSQADEADRIVGALDVLITGI